MLLGILALAAPVATGNWSLQFLGFFPLIIGATNFYGTVTNPDLRSQPGVYLTSLMAIAAALVLFASPSFVVSGLMGLLLALLFVDGVIKIGRSTLGSRSDTWRMVLLANGIASLALTLAGWWLWRQLGIDIAIGVLIGGYTIAAGWSLVMSPAGVEGQPAETEREDVHPDPKIGLGPNALFKDIGARLDSGAATARRVEVRWLLVFGLIMFIVHVVRMQSDQTWLGLVSPVVATIGDILMAVGIGALVVLPLRLLWRRISRPAERAAWQLRFSVQDAKLHALPRWAVQSWTDGRYASSRALRNARLSVYASGLLAFRFGLPLAALMAAVNPIWGFSWYFNTESWASAFYQKVTELRVDTWRDRMATAVTSAYDGGPDLFRVSPEGTESGDFRFLVIGDPGEGDASQYSLMEQYLSLGRQDDVRFLVISSDVIYPAGAMVDYERNFFMPYKGWRKPIYALPGNHDWFDALEGFNANFLEPKAAGAALAARVSADLYLTSTNEKRISALLASAARLRSLYGIDAARQRAPFFEIQTADFALLAIDTGIRRTLGREQYAWLDAALERSRGKFILAILGHPKYAAGLDTSLGDAAFTALYDRLEKAGVKVFMAGDTHAFEHYLSTAGGSPTHHFVNGGGGAYLSIGGALAWPEKPAVPVWEFYPPPGAVYDKLDAETPVWKQPMWFWVKTIGAWPISVETLSAMFDFNRAPFFQSFMEVRVERSKNRVVFALHGANGALRWRDLEGSPASASRSGPNDGLAEYVIDLKAPANE